jgi:hypothetical protein
MMCLKYLAQCPCQHCLILKSKIPRLGMEVDKKARQKLAQVDSKEILNMVNHARRLMFEDGINVSSVFIHRLLKSHLLVPTRVSSFMTLISSDPDKVFQNAFSLRLLEHRFNFYQMFVPDLMHEFELGVWKAVFTHLMHILHTYGNDTISILNSR